MRFTTVSNCCLLRFATCFLLFGFTLLLSKYSIAGTIKGHIKERKTGLPIAGASVFLEGTNYGNASDTSGEYVIENVPPGKYKLSVFALGYDKSQKSIEMSADSAVAIVNFSPSEKPITLNETIVHGRADLELESSARTTEKEASNIVNVISAQAIEQSTDRTAADVLQRVSGMSLVRNNEGEGRYVVMRGLEQQYNNTLIDGIKIPSPESKDRFVPLDIFPSALFERIEVTKSLTPDIAGDAIGGSTEPHLEESAGELHFRLQCSERSKLGRIRQHFQYIRQKCRQRP